jgi:hypothetical protein
MTSRYILFTSAAAAGLLLASSFAHGQSSRYDALTNAPFKGDFPTPEAAELLKDELFYQRAVQVYLWALPAVNMYAMKEGSEKIYGAGYSVLPVWKATAFTKLIRVIDIFCALRQESAGKIL